nr:t26-9p [Pyrococcus abyssi]
MDVNTIINQLQELARSHPYLALGLILLIIGLLSRGKISLLFYTLGALAIMKSFGLIDTFFSFLKDVPSIISTFGGG